VVAPLPRRVNFAGAGGLRLAADVLGNSKHPSIVFAPGAGQTRRAWRRTAGALALRGHHVISLDLRGHGDSAWAADGDYSIDAFIGDIRAVMTALPDPPILVGASIGGIACLIAAAEYPAPPARALVLVDVVPTMPGAGLDRIRAFMDAGAGGFTDIDAAAAAVARFLPHRPYTGSSDGLKHNLRRGSDRRLYWHWDPAFHAGSKQREAGGMLARMAAAARCLRIPALLVSGARSEVVNREGAAQLLKLMPQAQWIQVAGAAHMVAGDQNDSFDTAVSEFVHRLSSAGEIDVLDSTHATV
jgi:pimeloyl-ACP methyl ester carboxylesterase